MIEGLMFTMIAFVGIMVVVGFLVFIKDKTAREWKVVKFESNYGEIEYKVGRKSLFGTQWNKKYTRYQSFDITYQTEQEALSEAEKLNKCYQRKWSRKN